MILDFSQNRLRVVFEVTEDKTVILRELSRNPIQDSREYKPQWCNIAEIHVSGENPDDHHFFKHTGASRCRTLKYVSHSYEQVPGGSKLEFLLEDSSLRVVVHYRFYADIGVVRTWLTLKNISSEVLGLEYVASFSYTGIDVGIENTNGQMRVFVPHNSWMREVNWQEYTPAELGYVRTPKFSGKRIAFSGNGTWGTKEHLSMGALTNLATRNTLMWQIENNGAWHWEISDISDMMYLKVGGPNEQENAWHKALCPNESFESVKAAVAVGENFDEALEQMTAYRRTLRPENPVERDLPVIFNDYMNCLRANPTEEKMLPVIDLAAETGAEIYCMDAGWYVEQGSWWETVGEWKPSTWRFPHGFRYIFDYIRSKGMIPGIWLEIETMGIQCPVVNQLGNECFFMRHGKKVIDHGRYLLDFRNRRVRDYAMSVIDRVVCEYGAGYIKIDYNVDGGIGTEVDADSFGDGLLEHGRAYLSWLCEVKGKYPHLILENCASGGLRMDYASLSVSHIQSVSDQSEYLINAHIAAAASTAVIPEQAAIWSYPRTGEDTDAAAMNMVNTILQRIHLSGEIWAWTPEVMATVKEAVALYKSYRAEIPASIPFYPLGIPKYTDHWLVSAYRYPNCVRVAVWRLDSEAATLEIPLQESFQSVQVIYPSTSRCETELGEGAIRVTMPRTNTAVILELH